MERSWLENTERFIAHSRYTEAIRWGPSVSFHFSEILFSQKEEALGGGFDVKADVERCPLRKHGQSEGR